MSLDIPSVGTAGPTYATKVNAALAELESTRLRKFTALNLAARDALTDMTDGDLCVVTNIERTYRYNGTVWRPLDYDTGIVNVLDYGAHWSNADNGPYFQAAIDDTIRGGGTRDASVIGIPQPVKAGGSQQGYYFTTSVDIREISHLEFAAIGGNVAMPFGRGLTVELLNITNSLPIINADNESLGYSAGVCDGIKFKNIGMYGASGTVIKASHARLWEFDHCGLVTFANAPAVQFSNSFWVTSNVSAFYNAGTTTGTVLCIHESGLNPDIDACALFTFNDCIFNNGPAVEHWFKTAPSGGVANTFLFNQCVVENTPADSGAFTRVRKETAASGEYLDRVTYTNCQYADPTSGSSPWVLVSFDNRINLRNFIFDNSACGNAGRGVIKVRDTNANAGAATYLGVYARGGEPLAIVDSTGACYVIQGGVHQEFQFGSSDISYATAGTTSLVQPVTDGNGPTGHLYGVRGEAAARFAIGNDGYLMWGDGTLTAPDVHLRRSTTATLRTNGSLIVDVATTLTGGVTGALLLNQNNQFLRVTRTNAVQFSALGLNSSNVLTLQTAGDPIAISAGSGGLSLAVGTVTMAEANNFALGTTTGTKWGTATSQKQAWWNATPIVQPTTAIVAATFVANSSAIANDTATFDGYTIGQVVKALRNEGLLA